MLAQPRSPAIGDKLWELPHKGKIQFFLKQLTSAEKKEEKN